MKAKLALSLVAVSCLGLPIAHAVESVKGLQFVGATIELAETEAADVSALEGAQLDAPAQYTSAGDEDSVSVSDTDDVVNGYQLFKQYFSNRKNTVPGYENFPRIDDPLGHICVEFTEKSQFVEREIAAMVFRWTLVNRGEWLGKRVYNVVLVHKNPNEQLAFSDDVTNEVTKQGLISKYAQKHSSFGWTTTFRLYSGANGSGLVFERTGQDANDGEFKAYGFCYPRPPEAQVIDLSGQ